jgi:outer membrane receptor for ferric coprogen and ferric-rhodotorulic acid
MGSYVVIDAGLRWSIGERASIDFRGANLLNRFYPYNFYSNGSGSASFLMGAPRSGEVVFSYQF